MSEEQEELWPEWTKVVGAIVLLLVCSLFILQACQPETIYIEPEPAPTLGGAITQEWTHYTQGDNLYICSIVSASNGVGGFNVTQTCWRE